MDDRQKTFVAIAIIIGFVVLVLITIVLIITRKQILSPVPEDSGVKITFITPTPSININITPTPSLKVKPVKNP